ncbi:hypothetical protein KI387_037335, partial [Taxus chinensis]
MKPCDGKGIEIRQGSSPSRGEDDQCVGGSGLGYITVTEMNNVSLNGSRQEQLAIQDFLSLEQEDKIKYLARIKDKELMSSGLEQQHPSSDHPAASVGNASSSVTVARLAAVSMAGGGVVSAMPGGGAASSKVAASFKDAVNQKPPSPPAQPAYIVDMAEETPLLSLEKPE